MSRMPKVDPTDQGFLILRLANSRAHLRRAFHWTDILGVTDSDLDGQCLVLTNDGSAVLVGTTMEQVFEALASARFREHRHD